MDVPRVGFCGLMLPPLEDHGLARAVAEGSVSVQVRRSRAARREAPVKAAQGGRPHGSDPMAPSSLPCSAQDLLLYSSVCGIGLDCVPVPGARRSTDAGARRPHPRPRPSAGDTPESTVAATLGDVAALASRLQKPLSCRLFPVAGAGAGDAASFTSPYLCSTAVMALP